MMRRLTEPQRKLAAFRYPTGTPVREGGFWFLLFHVTDRDGDDYGRPFGWSAMAIDEIDVRRNECWVHHVAAGLKRRRDIKEACSIEAATVGNHATGDGSGVSNSPSTSRKERRLQWSTHTKMILAGAATRPVAVVLRTTPVP